MELLYIVILNYNGCNDTINCIDSVRKSNCSGFKLKILIVDNGSEDDSVKKIKKIYSDIEILEIGNNLGFAGGNNKGIQYAIENKSEYICLLNNDTLIDSNMLSILLYELKQNKKRIVGPATLFWNQEMVHSTGSKINFFTGTSKLLNIYEDSASLKKSSIPCDYLEGTCLMFHKDILEAVGLIPEVYFLYYEETEWCCRAKKGGYEIICIPWAKLWHKGSASVNKISGLKLYFEDRNRVLFIKRNAKVMEKFVFFIYFSVQLVYRIITRQRKYKALYAVRDAFTGKINWSIYSENEQ